MSGHVFEFICTEFSFVFDGDGKLKEKIEVEYYPPVY